MRLRDFLVGWRFLKKEPGYSSVVVFGLSIGFAVSFLLLGYVRYCLSYDSDVPQSGQIYLVENKFNLVSKAAWYELTPLPYLEVARQSGLIASGTPVKTTAQSPVKVDNHIVPVDLVGVSSDFQPMFGLHAVEGDLDDALSRPDRIAVTESTARRLFGEPRAVGKSVQINEQSFLIGAVLADPPANSTLQYQALTALESKAIWSEDERKFMTGAWANIGAKV